MRIMHGRGLLFAAVVGCALLTLAGRVAALDKGDKVDINSASLKDLEELPGVGPATAKKIVTGRPYASVSDLAKAGVSASTIEKLTPLVTAGAAPAAGGGRTKSTKPQSHGSSAAAPPVAGPTDLNTASEKDLEELPGVGPATAKKIVAGRPYASVADLSKAGVPASTIEKLTPLVTAGAAPAAASGKATSTKTATKPSTPAEVVDLNHASEKELEALPGVGAATAKKIVGGRPYSSVGDLSKAGVPASTIQKITPLVSVGQMNAPQPSKPVEAAPPATTLPTARGAAQEEPADDVVAQAPPQKGMVWVNLESKVFHREGDRWYGKTKRGKFMTEADAVAAGYREAKEGGPKKN